jgi:hypothetical protein
MWLPASYGRDGRVEYEALLERVTLWDVGCERALELTGPEAVAFADYLLTRDIAGQTVGRCRHSTACDEDGVIICEALVLRLSDERVWICHGPADFPLWARAVALHKVVAVADVRDAALPRPFPDDGRHQHSERIGSTPNLLPHMPRRLHIGSKHLVSKLAAPPGARHEHLYACDRRPIPCVPRHRCNARRERLHHIQSARSLQRER